jgi:SAM-dependent methyltransferase
MRIEYHRTLIADRVRNAAFHAALQAAITPGVTTVADIGAGTGLIGLMATKLGAKTVYLYETAAVGDVAQRILKANGAHKRCVLMQCHSRDMLDPPQVDLVVSETLGNYALEEEIVATLADARARFLKPGGVMIPRALTQFVAPVICDRIHVELTAWDDVGFGLDLSVARAMSLNNAYVRTLPPAALLDGGASAAVWDRVDFARDGKANRKGEAQFKTAKASTVYGFAVWWDADLGTGITLSTAPDAPRTHWEQLYFPVAEPIALAAGESIGIALRSRTSEEGGTHLAWTATAFDAIGKQVARQAMDLDKGYLP